VVVALVVFVLGSSSTDGNVQDGWRRDQSGNGEVNIPVVIIILVYFFYIANG